MNRTQYGKKQLLCLDAIPGRIESLDKKFRKVLLIEGFRYNSPTSILKAAHFSKTAQGLFKHGVMGIGLPMVIEYFWENGFKDFLVKAQIFLRRLFGFSSLLFRAKKMKLYLGKNPEQAAELIINYVTKLDIM